MQFYSERTVLVKLSDAIAAYGLSLYNAVKYFYSIGEEDFYRCNIKDGLKILLNNLSDADSLKALGLRINNTRCPQMDSEEFKRLLPMIIYSFAVRIPLLKQVKYRDDAFTDDQLHTIYETVIAKGAENYGELIPETFLEMKYLVKKNKPVPEYSADWFKSYIYSNVPELTAITNQNMFLLGFLDVLFPMFYSCMQEELKNLVLNQAAV